MNIGSWCLNLLSVSPEIMRNIIIGHAPAREIESNFRSILWWIGQGLLSDDGRVSLVGPRLMSASKSLFGFAMILLCFDCRRDVFRSRIRGVGGILSSSTADLRCGKQWRCSTGDGAKMASKTDRATQCRGREHEDKFRTAKGLKPRQDELGGAQVLGKSWWIRSQKFIDALDLHDLRQASQHWTPGTSVLQSTQIGKSQVVLPRPAVALRS